MNVARRQRPERRQVRGRDVDGAAPAVDDRHLSPAREEEPEAFGRLAHGLFVLREGIADPWRSAAAATAERDAAVARRAEIAQRLAQVADELPAGPADLIQLFGRGRREHDVAAPCGHAPADA